MLFLFTNLIASLSCPDIQPMKNFNTSEYIRSTWYIQQQQITGYQQANTLYCVAQTLEATNKTVPFFNGDVLLVYNYANLDMVNGPNQNAGNFTLCARQPDKNDPARILNAPCFLPNILSGPYWVLAAGPSSYNYSRAIVSGGEPNITYKDGNCSTSEKGINGSGLWLFTRERTGEFAMESVTAMRNYLISYGITTSQLLNVSQTGCNYTGAYIKS
jgi:hypothetical protein